MKYNRAIYRKMNFSCSTCSKTAIYQLTKSNRTDQERTHRADQAETRRRPLELTRKVHIELTRKEHPLGTLGGDPGGIHYADMGFRGGKCSSQTTY